MNTSPVSTPAGKSLLTIDPAWVMTTALMTLVLFITRGPRIRSRLSKEFNSDGLDRLAKLSGAACHAVSLLFKLIDFVFGRPDSSSTFLQFWTLVFFFQIVQRQLPIANQDTPFSRTFAVFTINICVSFISVQLARLFRLPTLPDSLLGRFFVYFTSLFISRALYDDLFERGGKILGWLAVFHNATPNWTYGTVKKETLASAILDKSLPKVAKEAYYRHQSLDDSRAMIRLIKLLPSKNPLSPVSCEIIHTSLSNAPVYDALSYTWGGQAAECVIYCGSKRLLITNNLFLAIARLRLPDDDRFIWADAVCIDQKNNSEKTDQVLLMKKIYQGAQRVVIWLGGDEGNSHSAIALLERLTKVLRHRKQPHEDGMNAPAFLDPGSELVSLLQTDRTLLGLPPSHDPSYNALNKLFERPYFRRMWIVQEIVMASETLVLCGTASVTLTWDDLAAVMRYVPDLAAYARTIPSALELGQLIERTRSAVDHGHARRLTLSKLLSRHNCSQASEPKDNIIGVIGMTSSHPRIRIDYNQDTSDFFRLVAVEVLKEDGSLDILGDIDHGVELTQTRDGAGEIRTASWVPHWQTSRALVTETSDTSRLADYGPFKSCGEYSSWNVSVREEQGGMGLLDVEGYKLDSIAKVGGYMDEFDGFVRDDYVYDDWERRIADVSSHRSDSLYSLTGETMLEVYWKTIYLGKHPPNLEKKLHPLYMRGVRLLRFLRRQSMSGLLWILPAIVLSIVASFLDQACRVFPQLGGERLEFMKKFTADYFIKRRRLFKRRMVRTSDRELVGLVPAAANVGDHIFLFKGSRVPIVVREDNDRLLAVGDCYIHGIMNGEAFEESRCSRHTLA
ncbi:heterokaryon incompatibility protein-domain-containing protein [Xylaria sp. FL1042]|nr:heterokaryon incompatibility protein-domain-containing protein [Xylaria sp. FL1042]